MYSKQNKTKIDEKNPARVSGGLKAQGVDSFIFLDENGSEKHIPSQRYVASLEEQLRTIKRQNNILEKKTSKLDSQISQLEVALKNLLNRR